jgi:AbrB-like transcriptional regulator
MKSTVLDSTKATSQADKLARFRRSLKTTRELQEAKLTSGVGGIDTFVEEVEGDWLESWGEEEKDKAKEEEIDPLAGKDLLQKIKVSSHLSRRETAKQSGYYSVTKNGQIHIKLTDFYSAVLAAKGLSLETGEAKNKQGHEPTFRINVNRNGQLVIDSIYVEKMGLTPGDELEITLGRKYIHLKKVESTQQLNKK